MFGRKLDWKGRSDWLEPLVSRFDSPRDPDIENEHLTPQMTGGGEERRGGGRHSHIKLTPQIVSPLHLIQQRTTKWVFFYPKFDWSCDFLSWGTCICWMCIPHLSVGCFAWARVRPYILCVNDFSPRRLDWYIHYTLYLFIHWGPLCGSAKWQFQNLVDSVKNLVGVYQNFMFLLI